MISAGPKRRRTLVGVAAVALALSATWLGRPVSTHASTQLTSYLVVDQGGTSPVTNQSPCDSSGCANGLRLGWTKGTCYDNDRYPPISIVWTQKQHVSGAAWPLIAPCSYGIQFSWDKYNALNKANYRGSSDPAGSDGLAICFQFSNQCSAGHCVTAGCIPAHTNGVDAFFQGADHLTMAQWLLNGTPIATITLSISANDVYWYGHTPPATPFPPAPSKPSVRPHDVALPTVGLLGRTVSGDPWLTTSTAPASANGTDVAWYLPLDQSGPSRGCFTAGGAVWAAPPNPFEYTKGGVLDSRVTLPNCPLDGSNNPMPFNDVTFSWGLSQDATTYVLTGAAPRNDSSAKMGCQKAASQSQMGRVRETAVRPADFPPGTIAAPPTGTDGVIYSFHHDDFKAACWVQDGTDIAHLSPPTHTRLARFKG